MSATDGGDRDPIIRNPYEAPNAEVRPSSEKPEGWFGRSQTPARLPAPASQFSIDCQCGRTTTVIASQAGSTVRCGCGEEVKVPSLGRLREMAGKAAYESGVLDTIRRMVQSGELPTGDACAVSGTPTGDTIDLEILVPRFFKNREEGDRIAFLFLGVLGLLFRSLFRRTVVEEEGAAILRVPLRVAARYHRRVRGMSQRRLRRLLRSVPVYATLLDENPHSRVSVVGGPP